MDFASSDGADFSVPMESWQKWITLEPEECIGRLLNVTVQSGIVQCLELDEES